MREHLKRVHAKTTSSYSSSPDWTGIATPVASRSSSTYPSPIGEESTNCLTICRGIKQAMKTLQGQRQEVLGHYDESINVLSNVMASIKR